MECLILGDSLPFGKPNQHIHRDMTWPYLLQHELGSNLCMRSRGFSTSHDVRKEVDQLFNYWFGSLTTRRFDAAIVQVGIVEACPRLSPKYFYPYVAKVPGYQRLQRMQSLYKMIGRPWMTPHQFIKNIGQIFSLLQVMADNILFIEIAPPCHYLAKNVGNFSKSIAYRNDLMYQLLGKRHFVSCWRDVSPPDYLLPDGHHLNEMGHQLISKKCLERF